MARLRHAFPTLLATFGALGAWRSIASPDAFWHLAAGRWMLEHGAIPRHDPFRFTSGGEAWVDHEWGFQLLIGLAEWSGGLTGVVAFRAMVFAMLALVLWRLASCVARRPGSESEADAQWRAWAANWLAGALGFGLLVTLDGLHGRMPLRPELLTLVCFALLLWILEAARRGARRVWLAVPLTVLWVNLHPGSMLAPIIAALHLLGRRLRPGAGEDRPGWAQVLGVPAATAAALACNPWGFDVVALPLRIRAALADLPATNPDWRALWDEPPVFLLGVLVVLVLVSLRTWGQRLDLPSAMVLAATVGLMVVAVRFQGLVWIAAFMLLARLVARMRDDSYFPLGGRLPTVALLILVLGCGVEGWRAVRSHPGVEPGRFPDSGVTALDAWSADDPVGNLFNSAVFGGYVLYRGFPPRQVFVDTRNEVDPSILRQLAEARADARTWRELAERYDLDAALVRYEDRPRQVLGPPAAPGGGPTMELHTTSALLFPQPRWALVHWDDVSMLFLRRTETRAGRLADSEYRFVQPEDAQATLQRAAGDPAFRAGVVAELQRKLGDEPQCRRARALLDALQP